MTKDDMEKVDTSLKCLVLELKHKIRITKYIGVVVFTTPLLKYLF